MIIIQSIRKVFFAQSVIIPALLKFLSNPCIVYWLFTGKWYNFFLIIADHQKQQILVPPVFWWSWSKRLMILHKPGNFLKICSIYRSMLFVLCLTTWTEVNYICRWILFCDGFWVCLASFIRNYRYSVFLQSTSLFTFSTMSTGVFMFHHIWNIKWNQNVHRTQMPHFVSYQWVDLRQTVTIHHWHVFVE